MTTVEAKPATSPEDLLKEAGAGSDEPTRDAPKGDALQKDAPGKEAAVEVPAPDRAIKAKQTESAKVPSRPAAPGVLGRLATEARRTEPRLVAAAGTALVLGAILGAGATSLAGSQGAAPNAAFTALATAIDAGRADTTKLAGSIAKLEQTVADLRAEASRRDTAAKIGTVSEKIVQLDRSMTTKLAGLGERIDQAEREQAGRLAALANRAKAEPTQTGSLAEPRDKSSEPKSAEVRSPDPKPVEAKAAEPAKAAPGRPPVLENYALRDVFEGAAIIESRNRRLYQVMPGDMLPGAGRVEGIERQRGAWVLVTRQGVVTPQPW